MGGFFYSQEQEQEQSHSLKCSFLSQLLTEINTLKGHLSELCPFVTEPLQRSLQQLIELLKTQLDLKLLSIDLKILQPVIPPHHRNLVRP